MSNNKPLADRILAVQQHCVDHHIDLDLCLDPVDSLWRAWDGQEQLTDGAESFEGMIEALEAELEL